MHFAIAVQPPNSAAVGLGLVLEIGFTCRPVKLNFFLQKLQSTLLLLEKVLLSM